MILTLTLYNSLIQYYLLYNNVQNINICSLFPYKGPVDGMGCAMPESCNPFMHDSTGAQCAPTCEVISIKTENCK